MVVILNDFRVFVKSYENVETNNGDQGFHTKVMLKEMMEIKDFL